ncbi:hypothetical protein HD554DRAFT_2214112 [Boletus coccyginus]|nr:hypothetical protein HD554DRAFT_2214112 [Boletus coccyginus]
MQARKRSATSGESSTQQLPNPKKLRFVDPSDDPLNFAEEVDNALENPSAKRKGRVRNEGYESDSSDDGEGVVYSRRKDEAGEADGDDDDMFSMGEKGAKKDQDGTRSQDKDEFLRLGDIEGQEFNESEHGSDSEDEPEDEDDARRRKQAGMGYELSSFNMREEMEEGKFAADGTYVKTFDPHAVHDRWMDGLDDKEIKIARRMKRQQERIQRERIKAEERELEQSGGKSALEIQLVGMLKRGETVLEALQRLGARSKKNSGKHTNSKSKDDSSMMVDKQPPKGMIDIDLITHLASNIMSLGDTDIYSKTYEELVRNVRSSGQVKDDWLPPSADVKYEYMWIVPGQQPGESYGPFGEEDMKTWFKASYFGVSGEKVQVRAVGGGWGEWDDVIT